MSTTTTNFGWTVPSDTDLVKDGAAAIRTALGGVDTSFVDLKGGTSGYVLSKASGSDLDFSWISPPAAAPNYALINTGGTALSGSSTVTISGISGKNDLYIFIAGAQGGDGNNYATLTFRVNTDTGSNYEYVGQYFYDTGTSGNAPLANNVQSSGTTSIALGGHKTPVTFAMTIQGANSAGVKPVQFVGAGLIANDYNARISAQGAYKGTSAISSISLISSGNFNAGTIYVYGA